MKKNIIFVLYYVFILLFLVLPHTIFTQDSTGGNTHQDDSLQLDEVKEKSTSGETDPLSVDDASSTDESSSIDESSSEEQRSLVEKTLAQDINTATYYELALWCKQLGIDDAGDLNALRARLFSHYQVTREEQSEDTVKDVTRKIEIKSADKSKYFTIEEIDENYLLLEGNVVVEIFDNKDDVKHEIKAQRIIFNQTENVLTAEEDIEYILIRSDGKPEIFKGESFSFDIDSWEGVFYRSRGETDKDVEEGKSAKFIYMGETISRLSNDTIILDKGTITSDKSPDNPYWKIKAKKIWVLAPGEWAVQDMVLFMGKVPILYFPFFFYPGDKLFFHPVIGYKEREGNFLQTTTYIIGEIEEKESPFSFLRLTEDDTSKYHKEIKGLFLRTTDIEKKEDSTKKAGRYLKLMVDVYSRLGGFIGIDGDFPDSFSIKGGIAFSRNIYPEGTGYTVYDPEITDDPEVDWNNTSIFGIIVPFRFAIETTFKYTHPVVTINGAIELFSDPVFPIDFYNREESFNVAELIGMEDIETTTTTPNTKSILNWSVNSTLNLSKYMPAPYIKTLSVSQCNLNFDWQSKEVTESESPIDSVDPSSRFYYPDRVIIPNFKMNIQGDLLTFPRSPASLKKESKPDDQVINIEYGKEFRLPFHIEEEQETSEPETGTLEEEKEPGIVPEFKEPSVIEDVQGMTFRNKTTSFSLTYSLLPEMLIELQFDKDELYSLDDVDFASDYTHFKGLVPFKLSYTLGIWGDFLKFSGTFSVSNNYQTKFNFSDKLTDDEKEAYNLTDYKENRISVNKVFTTTLKPFIDIPELATTFLEYRVNWLFYKYSYDTLIDDKAIYQSESFKWEEEYVSNHSAKANIIFIPVEKPFTYSFSTTLPPRLVQIDTYVEFYIWLFKTRVSTGMNELDDVTTTLIDGWYIEPVTISESITIENWLSFSQALNYDVEQGDWEDTTSNLKLFKVKPTDPLYLLEQELLYSIEDNTILRSKSVLNLWGIRAELLAEEMVPLTWDSDYDIWKEKTKEDDPDTPADEEFKLNHLDISYKLNKKSHYFWMHRIKWEPSIQSSFKYYFQHFTDSELNFTLDMDFTITEFLNFHIKSVSYNKNLYEYNPNINTIPGFEGISYVNPFMDLLESFYFWDKESRVNSSFNMRLLEISFVHHLYDWDLTFTFTGNYASVYDEKTNQDQNKWSPVFSIFIEWKPIPEIKKEVTYDLNGINIGG